MDDENYTVTGKEGSHLQETLEWGWLGGWKQMKGEVD